MALAISLASLSACSSLSGSKNAPVKVTWEKQKNIPFDPDTANKLPSNMANMVFLREADNRDRHTAVNIGVNNRYQASLHGGNYTAVPSCAGKNTISTLITKKKVNNLEVLPNSYTMQPNKNYYFEIFVDDAGNSQATPIAPEAALKKLKGKPLQSHTLSRVVQNNCPSVQNNTPVSQPVKLTGMYFFDFNAAKLNDNERQRVYTLAQKILDSGYRNYHVTLAGHADPVGNVAYNRALSDKRVSDVMDALTTGGINPNQIRKAVLGESTPTTMDCSAISKQSSRNNCNAKNRRVEAHVTLR